MVGDGKRYYSIMTMMIDDRNEDVDEKIGEDDDDDEDETRELRKWPGRERVNLSIGVNI